MPSLIVMMGVCFSKESVKKWWKISMTKFNVKFKTLRFKNVIQCKGTYGQPFSHLIHIY